VKDGEPEARSFDHILRHAAFADGIDKQELTMAKKNDHRGKVQRSEYKPKRGAGFEPPVEEPSNASIKPPVKAPEKPLEGPPPPAHPPVREPPDEPREPPVKEPPPANPNRMPPLPSIGKADVAETGRRGDFGSVIGVDPTDRGRKLQEHGVGRVVNDLSEIDVDRVPHRRLASKLPSAMNRIGEIIRWLEGHQIALFLDYDGTLTPIVEHPEQADLPLEVRAILKNLSERCTVAIVSGRSLKDVQERVTLERLYYAGSHGFEIDGPGPERVRNDKGSEALPALNAAENDLRSLLTDIQGAQVERKRYSVAVHYRRVASGQMEMVENKVDDVLRSHSGLRKGYGKKVFELQPDVEWNKGRAVLWLMERLGLNGEAVRTIYIGDDVTDEDAFRVLQERGAGIVVHGGEERYSYARYGLVDSEEVLTLLQKLSVAIRGGE
jgi:alpha,alpha-trehalase